MTKLFLLFSEHRLERKAGEGRAEYAVLALVLCAAILVTVLGMADRMTEVMTVAGGVVVPME